VGSSQPPPNTCKQNSQEWRHTTVSWPCLRYHSSLLHNPKMSLLNMLQPHPEDHLHLRLHRARSVILTASECVSSHTNQYSRNNTNTVSQAHRNPRSSTNLRGRIHPNGTRPILVRARRAEDLHRRVLQYRCAVCDVWGWHTAGEHV
jgi:hypothetical protein